MGRSFSLKVLMIAVWLLHVSTVQGYKHKPLHISENDGRQHFFIENFGFIARGVLNMEVTGWAMTLNESLTHKAYFYIEVTDQYTAEVLEQLPCGSVAFKSAKDRIIAHDWKSTPKFTLNIEPGMEGLYNLYFVNCEKVKLPFTLKLEQYNVDSRGNPDYLPIGLSPIPTIYAAFALAYAIIFVIWIFGYMRGKGNVLNKVHYLMSILVLLKCLSLFFYSIEQHFIKQEGTPNGWEYAYYIFAILRTSFFFIVVTLIGTGWSFFKPFLSEKDKKIIMVVIPLQILDNVAMVVVDVSQPGSYGLFTWKDIFRIVDIICCGAILIPIIWSIKHLREASQSDGKAARNLQKLQLFRQFYLIVVSYIYFTRIIVYLLDATLPYKVEFLGDICTELATLAFFCVVGHKFRPMKGNPYFNLEEEDAARAEEMRSSSEDF